ncbi:hypothetical protein, partial [Streptosporangium amethystogenes]|uniref:hypothetical protein n=1 Tax=Streptosporangium amethystogenes TaxID=2002 RepID=UPI0031DC8F18
MQDHERVAQLADYLELNVHISCRDISPSAGRVGADILLPANRGPSDLFFRDSADRQDRRLGEVG